MQEGERSERDFASAMGESATQKRSLRNARPTAAAAAVVPEKSDGDGVGGKRWRREKAEEPEKAAEAKR